jgi:beta-glucanase (GH16 family)
VSIDPNNLGATAHLTFDDEFSNLSLWNGSSGTWSTTFWYQDVNGNGGTLASNGEQEWYINANYGPTSSVKPWTDSNGVLTITASPTPSWLASQVNSYSYISGELNTYHSFSQTYGYFEMRAQLAKGQGFWPAFWLMPENGSWPPELDVAETLGQNPSGLITTVHSQAGGSYWKDGLWTAVPDTSAGYHTYGVDWEPDYITWYFDGQAVHKTATPADLNVPMYMIANLAAGGYWPGSTDGVSSAQMNIDYIRAYASGAGTSTPPASSQTPTSAPLNIDGAPSEGIVFRSSSSGDMGYMTLSSSGGEIWHASGPTSMAYASLGNGDFIGDGLTDVAFRNTDTGEWGFMTIHTGGGETWHDVGATSTAYAVAGVGDFGGTGQSDIAFVNTTTGDLGFMTANTGGGETWHMIGPTGSDYTVIGIGDFDSSGQDEVAFRNTTTGEWGYMTANASGSGETWHDVGGSSPGWSVLKVGDFDNSGHAEVAFRNTTTGEWGYLSPTAGGGEIWHGVGSTLLDYYAV